MGWPYDVVIQRGTCRFFLKITAPSDRNSSSISVRCFCWTPLPSERVGGRERMYCFVFHSPEPFLKGRRKDSEGGSSWRLFNHPRKLATVVSFAFTEFLKLSSVRLQKGWSSWFKSGGLSSLPATACHPSLKKKTNPKNVCCNDWKQMDTICAGRLPSTWDTSFRLTSRPLHVLHVYEVGPGIYRFTLPFFLYRPDGDGAPWIITMWIYDLFFLKWRVQSLHIPSLPGSQTARVRDLCLVWLAFKSHGYNNFLKVFFFFFIFAAFNRDEGMHVFF